VEALARVDVYPEVVHIAKLLLHEPDEERSAEVLFRRVLEVTGAHRGFILVGDDGSFEERFEVRFDREGLSQEEWQFSRALVREAVETLEIIHSPRLDVDPRFAGSASVRALGAGSVLVAPLHHAGEVFAVIYLQHDHRSAADDPFDERARRFLAELSDLAGPFIRRATRREAFRRAQTGAERELFASHDFSGIVTRDDRMIDMLKLVAQVADSDATALVRGETGTGKELVARALHANSARKRGPLVTINCGALPGSLLDAELFGHARGAFTGATRDRPGHLAAAAGGTVFLDEVGEIAPEVQSKLLRFLQFREIQRIGADKVETVDVRVVAATHRDLDGLVKAGKFRQDLLYRLNVVELPIPPLRERRGDIPLLVDHFTRRHWRRHAETPRWTQRAERALQAYDYPGNVRELAHLVERACLVTTRALLDVDLLPQALRGALSGPAKVFDAYSAEELAAARELAVADVEEQFLAGLLERCNGNVSLAAKHCGLNRTHLQKMLAKRRQRAARLSGPEG
jgi:Nif-specific regulatory protein/two-component system response regulator HydG